MPPPPRSCSVDIRPAVQDELLCTECFAHLIDSCFSLSSRSGIRPLTSGQYESFSDHAFTTVFISLDSSHRQYVSTPLYLPSFSFLVSFFYPPVAPLFLYKNARSLLFPPRASLPFFKGFSLVNSAQHPPKLSLPLLGLGPFSLHVPLSFPSQFRLAPSAAIFYRYRKDVLFMALLRYLLRRSLNPCLAACICMSPPISCPEHLVLLPAVRFPPPKPETHRLDKGDFPHLFPVTSNTPFPLPSLFPRKPASNPVPPSFATDKSVPNHNFQPSPLFLIRLSFF